MPIEIPDSFRDVIGAIAKLPESAAKDIADRLSHAKPALSVRKIVLSQGAIDDLENNGIDVYSIVKFILALHKVQESAEYRDEDFLDGVLESVDRFIEDDERAVLRKNLRDLFNAGNATKYSAKALNIFTEHQNSFRDCRIFSDVRIVFSESDEPVAAMVTHSLKIEYSDYDDFKALFYTMDVNDLKRLKKEIDRALLKEDRLKALTQASGLTFLDATDLLED